MIRKIAGSVALVAVALFHWSTAFAATDTIMKDGFEDALTGPSTDAEAARFLTQATFGPRIDDIQHLRAVGYNAWLGEQFAAAPSYETPFVLWVSGLPSGQNSVYQQQRLEAWLIHAAGLYDPSSPPTVHADQLRQRVAMALSEIFVVSDRNGALTYEAYSLANYHDVLVRNAFGNYRTLLEEVTLHPAMGKYLSMMGNRKSDPVKNIRPDENYAREILQLFSIGLNQLDSNGVPVLDDSGHPIPTYTQNTVRGFAHVFTGWNFPGCTVDDWDNCAPGNDSDPPWRQPMVPLETFHDNVEDKQLLNYSGVAIANGVLVHGGDARSELTAALNNIFNHPNVGPFISRQLIQRLVTSNPSPAYVGRVAAAFNNNGSGVRGDLAAVVRAILADDEARNGYANAPTTFGKPREPFFKLTQLYRLTHARSVNGRINLIIDPAEWYGQAPLRSPSVFNFFKPNFAQAGEIRAAGLVSPEYQIATDTLLVYTPNDLGWRIFYFYVGSDYSYAQDPDSLLFDYTELKSLAANSGNLVDRLNLVLMSGQMSSFMRTALVTRLNALPTTDGGLARVQHALYLILNSPEYTVQK